MRKLALFTSLVLVAAIAGCDSTPVGPPGTDSDATSAQFEANQSWKTGSTFVSFVLYAGCLGEEIHFYGEVPYRWHRVWDSSGGYSDVFLLEPATAKLLFTAEGISSGNVWAGRGSTDPGVYHVGPGEVIQLSINETYISKDGTNFRTTGVQHLTINANGDVTAVTPFTSDIVCTGQQ